MGKSGWRFPKEYDNVEQAWDEVRAGFVEAFRLASEERFVEGGALREGVEEYSRRGIDDSLWDELASAISYVTTENSVEGYRKLGEHLDRLEAGLRPARSGGRGRWHVGRHLRHFPPGSGPVAGPRTAGFLKEAGQWRFSHLWETALPSR